MKTNELISLLTEDAPVRMRFGPAMTTALLIGFIVSAVLFFAAIGIRHDMGRAIETARVVLKIGVTLALAIVASSLVFRIGRPAVPLKAGVAALTIPLVLMLVAVAGELFVMPANTWAARLVGKHAPFCVFFIPVMSIAPLVGFLITLRNGAPENPGLAGAVAGLAASGIAAAIYAWHCPDDSPLFVATWYTVAIVIVTFAGYLIGRRLLRW